MTDWTSHPMYRGVWKPLKPGVPVRLRRLFRGEPVVKVVGPAHGKEADLTGHQFWVVRWDDGLETMCARAHISTRVVPQRYGKVGV